MELHESGEMYLETILVLSKEKGVVRSIDIATEMNFSKPSVSRAVKLLKEKEYIDIDGKGYITLTEYGKTYAEKIYQRHHVLTDLLQYIGVDSKTAEEDACRIEHIISDDTYLKIVEFLKKQS